MESDWKRSIRDIVYFQLWELFTGLLISHYIIKMSVLNNSTITEVLKIKEKTELLNQDLYILVQQTISIAPELKTKF